MSKKGVGFKCYQKSVVGSSCSPPKRPINGPGWWKGKFASFQVPATGGGGGRVADICPEGPFTPDKRGMRAFMDRMGGRGGCMQKQQSSLVVIYTWPSGV